MLRHSDRRFVRLLAALVMAVAVTGSLLYGMNKIAVTLQMRDPTRYYKISDVIVPKPTGAAKRPPAAELQPAREQLQYGTPKKPVLPVDRPAPVVPQPAQPDVTPAVPLQHADRNTDQDEAH